MISHWLGLALILRSTLSSKHQLFVQNFQFFSTETKNSQIFERNQHNSTKSGAVELLQGKLFKNMTNFPPSFLGPAILLTHFPPSFFFSTWRPKSFLLWNNLYVYIWCLHLATASLFIIQIEKQVTVNKMLPSFKETGILKTHVTEEIKATCWRFIWIFTLDFERGENLANRKLAHWSVPNV